MLYHRFCIKDHRHYHHNDWRDNYIFHSTSELFTLHTYLWMARQGDDNRRTSFTFLLYVALEIMQAALPAQGDVLYLMHSKCQNNALTKNSIDRPRGQAGSSLSQVCPPLFFTFSLFFRWAMLSSCARASCGIGLVSVFCCYRHGVCNQLVGVAFANAPWRLTCLPASFSAKHFLSPILYLYLSYMALSCLVGALRMLCALVYKLSAAPCSQLKDMAGPILGEAVGETSLVHSLQMEMGWVMRGFNNISNMSLTINQTKCSKC